MALSGRGDVKHPPAPSATPVKAAPLGRQQAGEAALGEPGLRALPNSSCHCLRRYLVSGLAVVKGACVAAVGRGWVRAGRSHSSLKARRHHRCKGITRFFVVTSPNL